MNIGKESINLNTMKYIISLICLCLSGCFKSAPKPNPQIEDTILEDHSYEEMIVDDSAERPIEEKSNDIFAGNYEEHEIVAKIFFAFDSIRLSERDKAMINPVADQLKADPEKSVYVFGHTDWRGADDYNLSERRTQVIADYLQTLGIEKEKIYTIALGSRFATPNLSKEEGLKDRRCDIVIR